MSHIKTSSGFEADIDEAQLDDYRLMKAIRATESNPMAVVDVVGFVLGEEEDRLVEHVIATTGRATIEAINAELSDIFTQLGESKKK